MQLRLVLLFALLLAGLAACRRESDDARGSIFRGVVLQQPIDKPDFVLTDFNGQPFNLRLQTAGKVTLLFFGYTHCPDVCPLHAANVAAVLKRMPFETRDAIRFVFVTTDPERDTPERLKSWLGNFDSSFIGLHGPIEEINRIQAGLQIAPARKEIAGGDSANYLVGHAAQVIAFGPDGLARVEYPFGVRQEDWAHDLPLLVRGLVPDPGDTTARPFGGPTVMPDTSGPPIAIERAIVAAPPSISEASLYLVIRNNAEADTLQQVSSPLARAVAIHRTVTNGGVQQMQAAGPVPIAARSTTSLVPGELHVMLSGLSRLPAVGESVPVRLVFARAGEVVLAATVVAYADVERALSTKP